MLPCMKFITLPVFVLTLERLRGNPGGGEKVDSENLPVSENL